MFSPAVNESSCCSTSSLVFGDGSVSDFGHYTRCVVESHCFNLHFPEHICCRVSFCVPVCCLYNFFGEISVRVFCPFFNQVLHFSVEFLEFFVYFG